MDGMNGMYRFTVSPIGILTGEEALCIGPEARYCSSAEVIIANGDCNCQRRDKVESQGSNGGDAEKSHVGDLLIRTCDGGEELSRLL